MNARWNFKAEKNPTTVFVTNLPGTINKFALRTAFEKHGDIVEIRLFKKEKTFAYIEFKEKRSAQKSCKENGTTLAGSVISVAISNQEQRFVLGWVSVKGI